MFQRALELRKQVYGDEHTLVAESVTHLAKLNDYENPSNTIELLQQALEMRERLLGSDHLDVSKSLTAIASHYNRRNKGAEAEPFWRRAIVIQRKHMDDSSTGSLLGLAVSVEQQERYAEAAEIVREALGIWRKVDDDRHRQRVAQCETLLGRICTKQERYDEAEQHLLRAIETFESIDVPNVQYLFAIQNLVQMLRDSGALPKAEQWQRTLIDVTSRIFGKENGWVSTERIRLGLIQFQRKEWTEAKSSLEDGLRIREALLPDGDYWTTTAVEALEDIETKLDNG